MTKWIAQYVRISSDPLDLRAGVTRQTTDTAAMAAERWPGVPCRIYEDNDKSAYSGKVRPAFERMCADLAAGNLHAIVAWDQDRLLRLPRELEDLIALCDKHGFTNLVTASGDLDLTTHEGQFKARIMAAVAKKSSDDTSRRVRRMKADARAAGKHLGGRIPFGAELGPDGCLVPGPDAGVVADAARAVLAGESLGAIAHRVASEHVSAPQTAAGWRNLLLHTKVLDAMLKADVTAYLNARNRPRGITSRRHWLSGLVVCARCIELDVAPAAMRLTSAKEPSWSCVCRSTPDARGFHVSIKDKLIEPVVRTALFVAARIQPEPVRDQGLRPRTPERDDAPPPVDEGASERLSHLAALFAQGAITADEWTAARAAVTVEIPTSPPPRALPPVELEAVWGRYSVHQRHQAASALLEHVAVLPAGKGRYHQVEVLDRLVFRWRV